VPPSGPQYGALTLIAHLLVLVGTRSAPHERCANATDPPTGSSVRCSGRDRPLDPAGRADVTAACLLLTRVGL
jgi:hypothetical protein